MKAISTPLRSFVGRTKEDSASKKMSPSVLKSALIPTTTTSVSIPTAVKKMDPNAREKIEQAQKLCQSGNYLAALDRLDQALKISPDLSQNVKFHLNHGSYNFKAGRLALALEDFGRASDIDDQSATLHFNKGNCLKVMGGRDEEALREFQLASELDPKLADAHIHASQMQLGLKRHRLAFASAQRALELDRRNLAAHGAMLRCLVKLCRYDEAVSSVHEMIQLYKQQKKKNTPSPSSAKNFLDDVVPPAQRVLFARVLLIAIQKLTKVGDVRAITLARQACELNPCYQTYFELGTHWFAHGEKYEDAAKAFASACEFDASSVNGPVMQGASLIYCNQFDKALLPLRRALKSSLLSNKDEVRYYLGLAYLNLGRYLEAIPVLKRLVDNPTTPGELLEKARFLLASCYIHAGDELKAYELLSVARKTKRAEKDAEVHYQCGYVASLVGKDDDARECFLTCLQIDVNEPRALLALENLEQKKAKTPLAPLTPPPPSAPPPPLVALKSVKKPPSTKPPPPPPAAAAATVVAVGRKKPDPPSPAFVLQPVPQSAYVKPQPPPPVPLPTEEANPKPTTKPKFVLKPKVKPPPTSKQQQQLQEDKQRASKAIVVDTLQPVPTSMTQQMAYNSKNAFPTQANLKPVDLRSPRTSSSSKLQLDSTTPSPIVASQPITPRSSSSSSTLKPPTPKSSPAELVLKSASPPPLSSSAPQILKSASPAPHFPAKLVVPPVGVAPSPPLPAIQQLVTPPPVVVAPPPTVVIPPPVVILPSSSTSRPLKPVVPARPKTLKAPSADLATPPPPRPLLAIQSLLPPHQLLPPKLGFDPSALLKQRSALAKPQSSASSFSKSDDWLIKELGNRKELKPITTTTAAPTIAPKRPSTAASGMFALIESAMDSRRTFLQQDDDDDEEQAPEDETLEAEWR